MKRSQLALQSLRVRNFKSIQDSGVVEFTPLTAFIGNNGSGKSSIIEALEIVQSIVTNGVDEAMVQWHGFEHIWYKGKAKVTDEGQYQPDERVHAPDLVDGLECYTGPMEFDFNIHSKLGETQAGIRVNAEQGADRIYIQREGLQTKALTLSRDSHGKPDPDSKERFRPVDPERSVMASYIGEDIRAWQFVSLSPQAMGEPVSMKRTGSRTRLAKNGRNIAEYLRSILSTDPIAYSGLVEALQFVLPYVEELAPEMTTELERQAYLEIKEDGLGLPGWLLSTGTLRLVSLLALLRHPSPPSLIVIEEIENGLDPRTIGLLVEEIRDAVESGRTQVVLTTHSPYLLNLLTMSQIVLVERTTGQPIFSRPIENKEVKEWAKRFSPGDLYQMGQLRSENLR